MLLLGIVAVAVRLPIGMNLAGIADWETGFPFRNLMWGARKWSTRNVAEGGPWDTGEADAMPVDADGMMDDMDRVIETHTKP